MKNHKRNEAIKNVIKSASLFAAIGFMFFVLPDIFRAGDCRNAETALRVIAACEANASCMLTSRENRMKDVYVRMEAANCKRD